MTPERHVFELHLHLSIVKSFCILFLTDKRSQSARRLSYTKEECMTSPRPPGSRSCLDGASMREEEDVKRRYFLMGFGPIALALLLSVGTAEGTNYCGTSYGGIGCWVCVVSLTTDDYCANANSSDPYGHWCCKTSTSVYHTICWESGTYCEVIDVNGGGGGWGGPPGGGGASGCTIPPGGYCPADCMSCSVAYY